MTAADTLRTYALSPKFDTSPTARAMLNAAADERAQAEAIVAAAELVDVFVVGA